MSSPEAIFAELDQAIEKRTRECKSQTVSVLVVITAAFAFAVLAVAYLSPPWKSDATFGMCVLFALVCCGLLVFGVTTALLRLGKFDCEAEKCVRQTVVDYMEERASERVKLRHRGYTSDECDLTLKVWDKKRQRCCGC